MKYETVNQFDGGQSHFKSSKQTKKKKKIQKYLEHNEKAFEEKSDRCEIEKWFITFRNFCTIEELFVWEYL